MGIFSLLSFLPTEKQGREGRLAGGGLGWRLGARGRLYSEGKERGRREDPIPAVAWAGVVRGGPAMRVGGGGRGGAAAELGGGQGAGEKKRGGEGIPVRPPTLGRGGLWAALHGGGWQRAEKHAEAALRS